MLLGDAESRKRPRAELARHDHAEDARDVRLIRKDLEIEHQPGVRIEAVGDVGRPLGQLDPGRLRLRVLNALLDLTHRIQVLTQLGSVAGAQAVGDAIGFFPDRIEDAPLARMRACRAAALPPSPNSRSKTMRGCDSVGLGVVALRQDTVLT